jgi:uncharacterized LabA/DUF88 family protein
VKTIVYVDGYNLYYSRLKHTNYKWLDLFTLFNDQILRPQNPAIELLGIKYYTANILAKFASHGQQASTAQQRYHQALESPHTGPVEIIKGYYSSGKATPMRYKKPADKADKVAAWKIEEKQSDVNIALDLYRDALNQNCQQIVVCTNDTDIVPALKYIKQDFPAIKIGVVFPRMPKSKHAPAPAKSLAAEANWIRRHITDEELEASLFKDRVPTRKKPVDKPDYW